MATPADEPTAEPEMIALTQLTTDDIYNVVIGSLRGAEQNYVGIYTSFIAPGPDASPTRDRTRLERAEADVKRLQVLVEKYKLASG